MLRAIFGTDLCLKVNAPAVNATFADWWTLFGNAGPAQGSNIARVAVDQDGWISAMYNSLEQVVPLFLNGLVPANPNKITIGYRLKTLAAYASLHSIISLTSVAAPNDFTTYLFAAGPGGAPWLTGIGTEYYVEHTYDFVAGTCVTLVNGVVAPAFTPPAMSGATKAAWVAGTGALMFRLGNAAAGRYAIRDIYVLDDVVGDGNVAPLGAQRMYPIQVDSAVGAGWTPSAGGTVLDTLNAAPPAAAFVTSPPDKTPLVSSLKHSIPDGSRIAGIQLMLTGQSLGDAASVEKVEVSQNGTTLAPIFASVPKAAQATAALGVYSKAPDGTLWSLAKLDATAVKLTPDTSA